MDCYLLIADSTGTTVEPETKRESPWVKRPNQPSSNDCFESVDCIPHEQVHSTFKGSTGAYPFTKKKKFYSYANLTHFPFNNVAFVDSYWFLDLANVIMLIWLLER